MSRPVTAPDMLGTAHDYLDRGWLPVPRVGVTARGACRCGKGDQCGSPGKHPAVRWSTIDRLDHDRIDTWARLWPAGICLVCGARGGLVVVDVDPRHGGDDTLASLEADHGPLDTLTVLTGSGGTHLYFAHPGFEVPNDAGRKLGPGIDVRGDGGQVLAPPTNHPTTGRPYRWTSDRDPAPLPAWLAEALTPPPPRPVVTLPAALEWWPAEESLMALARFVEKTPEGERNNALNWAAYQAGRRIAHGQLDEAVVRDVLVRAAHKTGLTTREVEATVASGVDAGIRKEAT